MEVAKDYSKSSFPPDGGFWVDAGGTKTLKNFRRFPPTHHLSNKIVGTAESEMHCMHTKVLKHWFTEQLESFKKIHAMKAKKIETTVEKFPQECSYNHPKSK